MDPCPFVRVLIGNLALKLPTKPSLSRTHTSTSPYYCTINLHNFIDHHCTVPLVSHDDQSPDTIALSQSSLAACLDLTKPLVDNLLHKQSQSKQPSLRIKVYTGPNGTTCGWTNGKLLGKVSVELDLRGAETRASVIHSGWITIGDNKKGQCPQLYVSVKVEPDPRFVFKFGGEPESSPQVFQVQGGTRQAVFTCKFSSSRNSGDRILGSRPSNSQSNSSWNWLQSLGGDRDQSSKERKGWSISIHDLSGSPVAMASMVTPFVPSPGTDLVSRSNPGAWLILRPGQGTWKPWGRLEAWRERGRYDSLGYRFHLINDTVPATTTDTTLVDSVVNTKSGGKFTIDMMANSVTTTPSNSPQSSFDLRSCSESGAGSRPGSGSGSDFWFGAWQHCPYRGFVMSSTVEGVGKCSKPEVEVGVQHVTCTEDAAAFVALAAAMDLSMDACMLFSQKLRKELREHSGNFVV
ncbi:DUF1005 domain-containing protein [Cephalotus follicularis]|uniref:DUF1005 domain-containing protein n=1 Tax=Cephalotus follicularis TaxID=3775 RepID=A0A1Q3CJP2_CEPFO|nr:DUF1005 domain-containing protein [Cephalotus follicularis]